MKYKLYAIIHNNIVSDAWWAETQEEAEQDNPGATCIEVTVENSPWVVKSEYIKAAK
jgi:hypothetical protein